jgi:hypothetical protein
MGVCLVPENFEKLIYNEEEQKERKVLKERERLDRYVQSQRIIRANKLQIEKIKKKNLIKRQTLDKRLDIVNNDSILLLSSTKKNLAKTETNNLSESKIFFSGTMKSKKYDIINYPKDVVELINKIRQNPKSFITDVENAIPFIETYKNKLIYNGNTRVYLNQGKKIFLEAIQCLNETKAMNDLSLNEEISIELPNEKEVNDNYFFKNKILSQRKIKKIERYYREAIKDPYVGVLMMVVDDTNKNQGEKRKTILDPNLNKVGIKCKLYGNKFLAYLTFGK